MDAQADRSSVTELVRADWPPLRHVRRSWDALAPNEREQVRLRVEEVLANHAWGSHDRRSLLHLFTFLAQVETIAIEIPLRFLPHAPADVRPLLRRQLVDEVFHSTLFARLAHELALPEAQPPPPLASAERLLDRIRAETDLAVTATLLNLVAEGWIETLFKHALAWGVSKPVFAAVLADEARHVDEAPRYMQALDPDAAARAVHAFEEGMLAVSAEPTVALAIADLAGPDGQRRLGAELYRTHTKHLRQLNLQPSAAWQQAMDAAVLNAPSPATATPTQVPDTHWRALARQVWATPRDPTMTGDVDIPVGHIPKKLLTPVVIAALGQAWAKEAALNRVVARGKVWQLPYANVGVRVLLDGDELATVVIPDADKRSVNDIRRMLADGVEQLRRMRSQAGDAFVVPRYDNEVAEMAPATAGMFAVALSNAGKWGITTGAGSLSGPLTASTDFTMGLRRRLPRWRGIGYFPSWHVTMAAVQDHRVLDGRAAAFAVTGLQAALSRSSVKAILRRPDTLDAQPKAGGLGAFGASLPPELRSLAAVGFHKYMPIVIGGIGLGTLVGGAGYLLYSNTDAMSLAPSARAAKGAPLPPRQPAAASELSGRGAPAPASQEASKQGTPGQGDATLSGEPAQLEPPQPSAAAVATSRANPDARPADAAKAPAKRGARKLPTPRGSKPSSEKRATTKPARKPGGKK